MFPQVVTPVAVSTGVGPGLPQWYVFYHGYTSVQSQDVSGGTTHVTTDHVRSTASTGVADIARPGLGRDSSPVIIDDGAARGPLCQPRGVILFFRGAAQCSTVSNTGFPRCFARSGVARPIVATNAHDTGGLVQRLGGR